MSIKPEKANMSISATGRLTPEANPGSPIYLANTNQSLSEEDQATLENANASSKFLALKSQSLNPQKPVVLANTEFVQIGKGGESSDSSGLKAEFGEDNVISVNNVVKLMEIHKAVRNANLNNSRTILNIAKGYDNAEVLEQIRTKMAEIFDDIISEDINEIVGSFIRSVEISSVLGPGNVSTSSARSRSQAGSTGGLPHGQGSSTARTAGLTPTAIANLNVRATPNPAFTSTGLRRIVKENKFDPYFRTMIEYAAYEIILKDAIEYISGILRLKEAARDSWSILEATSYEKTREIKNISLSRMVEGFFEDSKIDTFGAHQLTADYNSDDKLKMALDVETNSSTTDIGLLLQSFASAIGHMQLRSDSSGRTADAKTTVDQAGRFTHFSNCHINALKLLKKVPVFSTYHDHIPNEIEKKTQGLYRTIEPTDGEDSEFRFRINRAYSEGGFRHFNSNLIEDMVDQFPSDMDDTEVYGELLAACIFNDNMAVAGYLYGGKIPEVAAVLGQAGATSVSGIQDYYHYLLNINNITNDTAGSAAYTTTYSEVNTFDPGNLNIDPLSDSTSTRGAFGFRFLSARNTSSGEFETQESGEGRGGVDKYIAFESTDNYDGGTSDVYLTGPEFFIDESLQRGDTNFTELNTFVDDYANFAKAYVEDVDKIAKPFQVEKSFRAMCKLVADDLQLDGGNDFERALLRLSILVTQAKTRSGLIRVFNSAFFAITCNQMGAFDGSNEKGPLEPFQLDNNMYMDGNRPQFARRRLLRLKSDKILKDFLRNDLNVRRLRTNSGNGDFRGFQGNRFEKIRKSEYTERDDNFDRINGSKTLNSGTGNSLNDGTKREYIIHKQPAEVGDDLNKEQAKLDRGIYFGVRCDSVKKFINNHHFNDTLFSGQDGQRSNFNTNRDLVGTRPAFWGGSATAYQVFPGLLSAQGEVCRLSTHHRAFLMFAFVAKILQESLRIKASSSQTSSSNTAKIRIKGNKDEMLGIIQAFRDEAEDNNRTLTSDYRDKSDSFKDAYSATSRRLLHVRSSIIKRVRDFTQAVTVPLIHANALKGQTSKIKAYFAFGGSLSEKPSRESVALSMLRDPEIRGFDSRESMLTLITEESVSEMYSSYVNTFVPKKEDIFTAEDVTDYRSLKLMLKTLTAPGYGFLSSEKRGKPTVCHVGITNSMLSVLRYDAYKETGNKAFLSSNRFCVNIFKRNEIDTSEVVYPKTFLFDSTLNIYDCNELGEAASHLENYDDSWDFNKIIENMEFTRWTDRGADSAAGDPFNRLAEAYKSQKTLGESLISSSDYSKELLINHVIDYALKNYYRYTIGLDMQTYNFLLNQTRVNFDRVKGGIGAPSEQMSENYEGLINSVISRYPAANVDPVLSSELFRAIKTIRAAPVYALREKMKRCLLPKKFNRILSIPYNEKDFILYTPDYDAEFLDVYQTTPNFTYTSQISRPNLKHTATEFDYSSFGEHRSDIEKYNNNCEEDFPEVFSTYVTITILPPGVI